MIGRGILFSTRLSHAVKSALSTSTSAASEAELSSAWLSSELESELTTALTRKQGMTPLPGEYRPLVSIFGNILECRKEVESLRQMVSELRRSNPDPKSIGTSGSDLELDEMLNEDLAPVRQKFEKLDFDSLLFFTGMMHKRRLFEEDALDCLLEVRPGVGGDEAEAFANELYSMYNSFCGLNGWDFESTQDSSSVSNDENNTQAGESEESEGIDDEPDPRASKGQKPRGKRDRSIHEGVVLAARIKGKPNCDSSWGQLLRSGIPVPGPYGLLRLECGVHRVQRVPFNCKRIQTSAASVAVIPKVTLAKAKIREQDLKLAISQKASGPGGSNVNISHSQIRITHLPTGICVMENKSRGLFENEKLARQKLQDLLDRKEEEKVLDSIRVLRSSLSVVGDRSEKIRTYNFMRNEITDHRISDPSTADRIAKLDLLETMSGGDLSMITQALYQTHTNQLVHSFVRSQLDAL